ncbi:hypothetical protein Tcan_08635 [Toxocara canis]|uniref:Uncharacterized protein n=1 Tax=Toxocara canis TaxID=6265 RepID=A0A0B2W271_TOXCA|nr:hypothetical protein Tcan_08635 [Toxocara canis]
MLYSHVTLLMLRVVDVVAKTTVQQSARMLVADVPGDVQLDNAVKACNTIGSLLLLQKLIDELAYLDATLLNKLLFDRHVAISGSGTLYSFRVIETDSAPW